MTTHTDKSGTPYWSPDNKPAQHGTTVKTSNGGTGTMIGGNIVKK